MPPSLFKRHPYFSSTIRIKVRTLNMPPPWKIILFPYCLLNYSFSFRSPFCPHFLFSVVLIFWQITFLFTFITWSTSPWNIYFSHNVTCIWNTLGFSRNTKAIPVSHFALMLDLKCLYRAWHIVYVVNLSRMSALTSNFINLFFPHKDMMKLTHVRYLHEHCETFTHFPQITYPSSSVISPKPKDKVGCRAEMSN